MTTLITGGAGFVGAELARLLIDKGERPIVMDVSQLSGPLAEHKKRFDYVKGSVANLPEVLNALDGRKVERIIHLGRDALFAFGRKPVGSVQCQRGWNL